MDKKDKVQSNYENDIEYTDVFFPEDESRGEYIDALHANAVSDFKRQLNGRYRKKRSFSAFGGLKTGIVMGVVLSSLIFVLGSFLIKTAGSGLFRHRESALTASSDPEAIPDELFYKKLENVKKLIDDNYIFEYKKSQIQNGILKGLVDSLQDPYSQYYTAQEFKKAMEQYNGAYTGIGVVVRLEDDKRGIIILNVYSGSPAEKAGLKTGDLIIEVNGEEILPETPFENTIAKIKGGPKGSTVDLTIIRDKKVSPSVFKVVRDEINVETVTSQMLENKIGYIKVYEFSGHTVEEFDRHYKQMEKSGARKMIIDLRDNPGGSFTTVCRMLDGFLKEGIIVYTKDKSGHKEYVYADSAVSYKLPMAVLINKNSASASEIFASTVKDLQLGILVGENSFGKGIVQNTIPFSDGTAIKLTISRYYTASGAEIHEKGIAPDVKVIYRQPKLKKNEVMTYQHDNQIMRAIKALK